MLKAPGRFFKSLFKKSDFFKIISTRWLCYYLKFVYLTSKIEFFFSESYGEKEFREEKPTIFVFWHNNLALALRGFKGYKNIYALISSHSDGKIIAKLARYFKFGVIEGSSNKNPIGSLREIIKKLSAGSSVVITPDGPRGPVYKVKGVATEISLRYKFPIVPVSCISDSGFRLKSWDGLFVPFPLGKIKIIFGAPAVLSGTKESMDERLGEILNELREKNV